MPVLLMVSGGSDSMAMLELACAYCAQGNASQEDELVSMLASSLPSPDSIELGVLHVNHMLRGEDADEDERFVRKRCAELGVACHVERVDIGSLAKLGRDGIEAVARKERYRLAAHALESMGAASSQGITCTAHTLDDRIETFFMRSLVGTGPGGFASIPRVRGVIRRPLLDATREQLRDWLRTHHAGVPDSLLWREDATNNDGSNFRSQIRGQLIPVLRGLRPGFEAPLAQTMDLIAEEDDALNQEAQSIVYRNLNWDGTTASLPLDALDSLSVPMIRRVLRCSLFVVNPDARLESTQIARIYDHLYDAGYATETSGGVRVRTDGSKLLMRVEQ